MSRQVCLITNRYNLETQKTAWTRDMKLGDGAVLGVEELTYSSNKNILRARYVLDPEKTILKGQEKSENKTWKIPIFKKNCRQTNH